MAIFLPAGSPETVVKRLNKAVGEALADATVQKSEFPAKLRTQQASSPTELGQYLGTEIETYRQIVAGVRH